ncbi:MAG TPA: OmpA family protein [Gammaproteobacteria bacterium]|nr:OmpA family protein [Gammaproteobacteria bacterium]
MDERRSCFPKVIGLLTVVTALALGGAPAASAASADPGYLTASNGSIVTSGAGECWHTSRWTPDDAVAQCEPGLVAQRVQQVEPAAGPVARVEPPPPSFRHVTLNDKAYFAFDKARLRAGAKQQLKQLLGQAHDMQRLSSVTVVGYADRIGPARYNKGLSRRRAEAVKQYLVQQGVNPDAIEIRAMGEKDPVKFCPGNAATPRLIQCLAPNRRAVITIKATQTLPGAG